MLRQRLLIGASRLCSGIKPSAPTVRCTPGVANASSLRVIAASIAALARGDPTSAAFLFGRYAGQPRLAHAYTVSESSFRQKEARKAASCLSGHPKGYDEEEEIQAQP